MKMADYNNKKEFLAALAAAPKGMARKTLLDDEANRRLIAGSGANVTLYAGKATDGNSPLQNLDKVYVGVLQRRNARTGKPDGWGTWGGLAERTEPQEFASWTEEERRNWVGLRDDVVLNGAGTAVLTEDMEQIVANNIRREAGEELADLGIYDIKLDLHNLDCLKTAAARDDNFAVNIWNGQGEVKAISPYCCLLKVDEDMLDRIEQSSRLAQPQEMSEAYGYRKMKLTAVLSHWGKLGGKHPSDGDGRDMESDYRYPHEWLATWAIAAKELRYDEDAIVKLAAQVQGLCSHRIDFAHAAERLEQGLDFVAAVLKMSPSTVKNMQQATAAAYAAGHVLSPLKRRDM